MMALGIVFLLNILEGFSVTLLYLLFFAKEVVWNRKKMAVIAGVYTISIGISVFMQNTVAVNTTVLALIFFTGMLCTGKRLYNFFMILPALLFFTLLFVCPEYIVGIMLEKDVWNETVALIDSIPSLLIDVCLFSMVAATAVWSRKRKLETRLSGWEVGGFCLYFLFALFELFAMEVFKNNLSRAYVFGAGVIALFFLAVIFGAYWLFLMTRRKNKKLENDAREAEQYLAVQLELLEHTQEDQEELRQFRHDLSNHMQVIGELCAGRKYRDVETYVAGLSGKIDRQRQACMQTGQVADMILTAKKEEAFRQGTEFVCEGEFQKSEKLEPMDTCAILANLLDNALEASGQIENGKILIKGVEHKNYFTLTVSNRVAQPVKIRNNRVTTTKKDRHMHGIGLASVQNAVQKYQGECMLSCEDNWFTAKVILPI